MAILADHVRWYEEIFAIEGFFSEPVLLFGFQEIGIGPRHFSSTRPLGLGPRALRRLRRLAGQPDLHLPEAYRVADLVEFLRRRGLHDLHVVDHFDARADLLYDMNRPVPDAEHNRYGTFIDIGSLEHVFDTRQCLENCLRMVRPGGVYFLHTCVRGYYKHGFHTFHPEALTEALTLNGFEILFRRYSTADGEPLENPALADDVLIWLVGRKVSEMADFVCPQQGGWKEAYAEELLVLGSASRALRRAKRVVYPFVPPVVVDLCRALRGRRRRSLVAPALRRK